MSILPSHRSHTFATNFSGAVGHVMTAFVWLLIADLIVIIGSLATATAEVSDSFAAVLQTLDGSATSVQAAEAASSGPNVVLQFLLCILLLVVGWLFGYIVAKTIGATLRKILALLKIKVSSESFAMAKYMTMTIGLIGLIVLLQYIPASTYGIRVPVAFLGFAAGVVGLAAIWAQEILIRRYRVGIAHVL